MHGVSAVPSRVRACKAPVALVAVLALVVLCTGGIAVGRARSDLLFFGCAFALTAGGFLLYGFNADAPAFFDRSSLFMVLVLAAAARDVWFRRGEGEVRHAR